MSKKPATIVATKLVATPPIAEVDAIELPEALRPIFTLEQARALPEVAGKDAHPVESDDPNHVLAFIAEDGRTMRVVTSRGGMASAQFKPD